MFICDIHNLQNENRMWLNCQIKIVKIAKCHQKYRRATKNKKFENQLLY